MGTFIIVLVCLIVFSLTHQSNLLKLNQDVLDRMLEYLPLNQEVHNFRSSCRSCRNISTQQEQKINNYASDVFYHLFHIESHPNNASKSIKYVTKLYDTIKFNQRFALYLPGIIQLTIQINNQQLLHIFNINLSQHFSS